MTDLPISHLLSGNSTEKTSAISARMIALFETTCGALVQAAVRQSQRRTLRRAPEEILMAQVRRNEARRAVDRLLR